MNEDDNINNNIDEISILTLCEIIEDFKTQLDIKNNENKQLQQQLIENQSVINNNNQYIIELEDVICELDQKINMLVDYINTIEVSNDSIYFNDNSIDNQINSNINKQKDKYYDNIDINFDRLILDNELLKSENESLRNEINLLKSVKKLDRQIDNKLNSELDSKINKQINSSIDNKADDKVINKIQQSNDTKSNNKIDSKAEDKTYDDDINIIDEFNDSIKSNNNNNNQMYENISDTSSNCSSPDKFNQSIELRQPINRRTIRPMPLTNPPSRLFIPKTINNNSITNNQVDKPITPETESPFDSLSNESSNHNIRKANVTIVNVVPNKSIDRSTSHSSTFIRLLTAAKSDQSKSSLTSNSILSSKAMLGISKARYRHKDIIPVKTDS